MNNAMLSIYSNKVKKFYDRGFSKEEVKIELEQEKEYYENALYEVNKKKNEVESLTTLEEVFNHDGLGFKQEFGTFGEFVKNLGNDLAPILNGCLENMDYHVCSYYSNPKDTMCTRWEVEQRIYVLENQLMNL